MNLTSQIQQRVSAYVEREGLFAPNELLLVALSGGADSVALLHVLRALGVRCMAAHCNFHLRGEESYRDEEFCINLCRQLDVQLHVIHFDTEGYAHEKGISIEMAARELRYLWFDELCHEYGYAHVAVAHHRDDSIETMLLNLVRGTGIAGLTGIRPINGHVVRPLLCLSREEILAYLKELGQDYVTDSTNLQDEYMRNRIRLHLLPMMEELNPSVREGMTATMEYLRSAETIYNHFMEEAIKRVSDKEHRTINIPALLKETSPSALLFELLRPYGFVSTQVADIFHSLLNESGRLFNNKQWQVLKDRETLVIRPLPTEERPKAINVTQAPTEVELPDGKVLQIYHKQMTPDYQVGRTPDIATFDASQVTFPLTIRPWQQGDKIAPFGMKGRKKLVSDLLTDLKLSRFDKENQLVLTDANNRILWVIGHRTAEYARVTKHTHEVIEIRIKENGI